MKEFFLYKPVSARRTLGGVPVQGFSEDFAYDPIGNRVSATDYDEGGKPRTSLYSANALNQYVSRTVPGWASVRGLAATNAYVSVNGNEAFTVAGRVVPNAPKYYFGSGDFDNSAQSGWAELETYATVNGPTNDLVSAVTNRVFVPQTPETFAYDADGNLTEDGRFRYWWNGENRMVRAEEKMPPEGRAAHVIVYSYDHQGRNVAKDGSLQIWDAYNIVVEAAATSNATINVWGLDIDGTMQGAGGVGGLLAVVRSGSVSLPFYDANGNITEYVDSLGGIESHADYSAFGRGLMRNGVQSFSHGFSTKPWCRKSGLVEYQMRKYMPCQGRWMLRDGIGEVHRDYSLFLFCDNDVINEFDLLGFSRGVTKVFSHYRKQNYYINTEVVMCKADCEGNCREETCGWGIQHSSKTTVLVARQMEIYSGGRTRQEILEGLGEEFVAYGKNKIAGWITNYGLKKAMGFKMPSIPFMDEFSAVVDSQYLPYLGGETYEKDGLIFTSRKIQTLWYDANIKRSRVHTVSASCSTQGSVETVFVPDGEAYWSDEK